MKYSTITPEGSYARKLAGIEYDKVRGGENIKLFSAWVHLPTEKETRFRIDVANAWPPMVIEFLGVMTLLENQSFHYHCRVIGEIEYK